jgi:hypothetical protein
LSSDAAAVLALFPGPVTLTANKIRRGFVLFVGVAGAVICLFAVAIGKNLGFQIFGAIVAIPFIAGAIWAAKSISDNKLRLRLDGDGFARDGGQPTRWADVKTFWFYETFRSGAYVGFDRESKITPSPISSLFPAMVPFDQRFDEAYGFRADELAALLNRWREQALVSQRASSRD